MLALPGRWCRAAVELHGELTFLLPFGSTHLNMNSWSKLVRSVINGRPAAAAKSFQSCPTLCNPRDSSPPGSPVPGILQARTLEWVAISFSNAWKWKVKGKLFSCVRLFATPWTAADQAPLSMGLSRQEYWSRLPLPSPIILLFVLKKSLHRTQRKCYSLHCAP